MNRGVRWGAPQDGNRREHVARPEFRVKDGAKFLAASRRQR